MGVESGRGVESGGQRGRGKSKSDCDNLRVECEEK